MSIPWNKGFKTGIIPKTAFKKGNIPWHKGKEWSLEIRQKISSSRVGKGLGNGFRKECIPWNKGLTKETDKRVANSRKGGFKKGIYTEAMRKGSLLGAKALAERKPTSIEIKVYDELKRKGLLFETQKLINGKFLVDAYIPSLNLIIEADGDYWHSLDRIVKKDKAENAYLKRCGYQLLRLSETEINSGNFIERMVN